MWSRRLFLGLTTFGAAGGFEGLPISFEDLARAGEPAHFKWTARVSAAELAWSQRLRVRVSIKVDGRELVRRRGKGKFVMLAQIRSRDGRVCQTHNAMDLEQPQGVAGSQEVSFEQDAFIVPGEYGANFAVIDTATREYSILRKTFRVPGWKNDPLPGAWDGLPPVQFLSDTTPPEVYYQPSAPEPLHLRLDTRRPVAVTVLMNATRPERVYGNRRPGSRNLEILVPALRALSEVNLRSGSLTAELLDLSKQRVSFRQTVRGSLDWSRLRDALAQADPNTIDVRALENRRGNAQFFVGEVRRPMAAAGGGARAVIVLSAPMQFQKGEDLRPIQASADPGCRIFYVRCYSRPARAAYQPGYRQRPDRGNPQGGMIRIGGPPLDELEHTLEPLKPRVFEVDSPLAFRKALAAIFSEIAKL